MLRSRDAEEVQMCRCMCANVHRCTGAELCRVVQMCRCKAGEVQTRFRQGADVQEEV